MVQEKIFVPKFLLISIPSFPDFVQWENVLIRMHFS